MVDYSNPEAVAAAYITASMSLNWHWATAAGYLPAVRPMVTEAYWKSWLAPMATEPSGAEWGDFKLAHGIWTIIIRVAQPIPEAPHDANSCWIRIVYDILITADAAHGRPGGTPESSLDNVAMSKVDGRWLVDDVTADGG